MAKLRKKREVVCAYISHIDILCTYAWKKLHNKNYDPCRSPRIALTSNVRLWSICVVASIQVLAFTDHASWGPPYLPWTLHAAVFLSGTLCPDPPKLASQFLNIKNHNTHVLNVVYRLVLSCFHLGYVK